MVTEEAKTKKLPKDIFIILDSITGFHNWNRLWIFFHFASAETKAGLASFLPPVALSDQRDFDRFAKWLYPPGGETHGSAAHERGCWCLAYGTFFFTFHVVIC